MHLNWQYLTSYWVWPFLVVVVYLQWRKTMVQSIYNWKTIDRCDKTSGFKNRHPRQCWRLQCIPGFIVDLSGGCKIQIWSNFIRCVKRSAMLPPSILKIPTSSSKTFTIYQGGYKTGQGLILTWLQKDYTPLQKASNQLNTNMLYDIDGCARILFAIKLKLVNKIKTNSKIPSIPHSNRPLSPHNCFNHSLSSDNEKYNRDWNPWLLIILLHICG